MYNGDESVKSQARYIVKNVKEAVDLILSLAE